MVIFLLGRTLILSDKISEQLASIFFLLDLLSISVIPLGEEKGGGGTHKQRERRIQNKIKYKFIVLARVCNNGSQEDKKLQKLFHILAKKPELIFTYHLGGQLLELATKGSLKNVV